MDYSGNGLLLLFKDIIMIYVNNQERLLIPFNKILEEYGLKTRFISYGGSERIHLKIDRNEIIPDIAIVDIINLFFLINSNIDHRRSPEYFNHYSLINGSNIRIVGDIEDYSRNLKFYAVVIRPIRKL